MDQSIIGQVFFSQYQVESFIYNGENGAVFRVWDTKRNVFMALTFLDLVLDSQTDARVQLKKIAQKSKKLSHPKILPFYGYFHTRDVDFILQEYVKSQTLKQLISKLYHNQPLPLPDAMIYMKCVCAALGYAHSFSIIHEGLKPATIFVDESGNIFLSEFSIASHVQNASKAYGAAGSAAYLAPELIIGNSPSIKSDIYALGTILYELLTGQHPLIMDDTESEIAGETQAERLQFAHLHLVPTNPCTLNPSIPPLLGETILKAMSKQPEFRHQSAQDFFIDLCRNAAFDPAQIPDNAPLAFYGENKSSNLSAITIFENLSRGILPRITGSTPVGTVMPGGINISYNSVETQSLRTFNLLLWVALASIISVVCLTILFSYSMIQRTGNETPLFLAKALGIPTETPLPTETSYPTMTPRPTRTPTLTFTPAPIPSFTPTLSLADKMKKANILVYENIRNNKGFYGQPLDLRIDQVLNDMGLASRNVVRDYDALGNFTGHLNSGTDWDLIIYASESRQSGQGEIWDLVYDRVTKNKAAFIAEMWYLDKIYLGKIAPLLGACGISVEDNWVRMYEQTNVVNFTIYFLDPGNDIFNYPNKMERGMLVPVNNYAWRDDVGDRMKIIGGDAVMLGGTSLSHKKNFGTLAECMNGRVILQTFSTHDYRLTETKLLWENYITYALNNRFRALENKE